MNLTDLLERFAQVDDEHTALKEQITQEVLKLQRSQNYGRVTARYSKGQGRYNYTDIAYFINAPKEVIDDNSQTVVDWKGVVESLDASQDVKDRFYKAGTPTVSIKVQR